jgi:nucleoside 2-deoxyribosyltransferase
MLNDAIELEKEIGEKCYIPGRDTDQKQHGDFIYDNLEAMKNCLDIVYCIWDGESFGTMFDMGMAYALGYKIIQYKIADDKHWKRYFMNKHLILEKIEYDERKDEI